jgi:hypothetical protein
MAFPTSPANNQTALVNGIVYQWNGTLGVWKRNGSVNSIEVGQLLLNSAQRSTTNGSGTLIVSGGAGITGNVYTGGIFITGAANGITFVDGSVQTSAYNSSIQSGIDATQNTNITIADTKAQNAFDSANTKLSTTGGTITGTLTIDGEAGITGNLSVTNTLTVGTLRLPGVISSNVSLFTGINTTQNTNINIATVLAQAAFDKANTAEGSIGVAAFDKANSANVLAQSAFDKANTSTISITDDTTNSGTYYPLLSTSNTGTLSTSNTSSSKLSYVPSTGTLTTVDLNTTSDIKFKDNIQTIDSALEMINSIDGVSFNWKETGKKSYGVIAQQLQEVLPELVSQEERGLSVSYLPIIAILIEAIKEQQKQINDLK